MDESERPDGLDDSWRDRLVAIGKGAAGAIPWGGGLVAEIVGAVIPGQRADRIADYLRALSARVDAMSTDLRDALPMNAEKIDLIEEAATRRRGPLRRSGSIISLRRSRRGYPRTTHMSCGASAYFSYLANWTTMRSAC